MGHFTFYLTERINIILNLSGFFSIKYVFIGGLKTISNMYRRQLWNLNLHPAKKLSSDQVSSGQFVSASLSCRSHGYPTLNDDFSFLLTLFQ